MASNSYITNRKKFIRPQAMLWSNNPGTLSEGLYVPDGYEVGTNPETISDPELLDQFIVLSDHGRSPLSFNPQRIEKRERMINGRMRSYHIADKLTLSTSWDMLPSRSYNAFPDFNPVTGKSEMFNSFGSQHIADQEFTADGGAGGVDVLNWYENHEGSFWVYLAYDRYDNFEGTTNQYNRLSQYNEIVEMYISDLSYSVETRSGSHGDLWTISVSLEEV